MLAAFCISTKNYKLLFGDVSQKLLLRCLNWIKGGGVRDTNTLIFETKKNFPDANLDVLYELLNVDKETFRLPPLPGVFCLFIFVSNLYFAGWGKLVFFDADEHQITDKEVLLASIPRLEAQWKIIFEFKPTEYPQLHRYWDILEITYDDWINDGGIPNLAMSVDPEHLNLGLHSPDGSGTAFRMDLPRLQEWTRIEISHVEEGGQYFLSFTVGGQTKKSQAYQDKGNLRNLTGVKIYIGSEFEETQPGFVRGLLLLDQQ